MAQTIILDSRLRSLIVLLPALGIAMWIASELSSGEFLFPLFAIIAFVALVFFSVFTRVVRVEAAVLNMLLVGYLVGNRGFAELTLAKPLYPGEVALAVIFISSVIRYVLSRELPDLSGLLARLILIYLAVGAVRLSMDYSTYHMDALRDSAMVYYSVFFFFGRELAAQPSSKAMLEKCLRFSFLVLVPITLIQRLLPETFMVNILSEKDDILTTFSAVGVFVLYTRPNIYGLKWLRGALILYYIGYIAIGLTRASLAGLMVGAIVLFIARQWRFIGYFVAAVVVGMTVLGSLAVTLGGANTTDASVMVEKFESMVDVTGSGHYSSEFGDLKAGTNEFRRTLWQSFIDQADEYSPTFGRGFGYDFLVRYQEIFRIGEAGTLRSAHNFYITLYGRMGIIGSLVFLLITYQIVAGGVGAGLAVRAGWLPLEDLCYWCGAWAILVAAIFGVVLEGPMGAIVFWSFLGIAVKTMQTAAAERNAALAEAAAPGLDLPPINEPRRRLGYRSAGGRADGGFSSPQ